MVMMEREFLLYSLCLYLVGNEETNKNRVFSLYLDGIEDYYTQLTLKRSGGWFLRKDTFVAIVSKLKENYKKNIKQHLYILKKIRGVFY